KAQGIQELPAAPEARLALELRKSPNSHFVGEQLCEAPRHLRHPRRRESGASVEGHDGSRDGELLARCGYSSCLTPNRNGNTLFCVGLSRVAACPRCNHHLPDAGFIRSIPILRQAIEGP